MPSKKKTIEETYQKLSPREHVLHRGNMYIGEAKMTCSEVWVFDSETQRMVKRAVEYSPGFLKVFDEVLTNATDHATRDLTLNMIKVEFDKETGVITVYNNGGGVPVVEHKEHKMYVPELIFGHLLAGSNYDDSDQRTGSGVNGVGIKCTNIFSKEFIIETIDSDRGLKFSQKFYDNMEKKDKPKVTKNSGKSYTKVTFLPDYERFGMKGLDDDIISLICKRVYDCIVCTNPKVSIYLNGEKLKGKGLQDYVKYFFDEDNSEQKVFYENATQKVNGTELVWEYAIVPWNEFEHVSFVNGNSTCQGGKHVDNVMYQITNKLQTLLTTKKKVNDVKPAMIREKMFMFLRATVINPNFNSQTKEYLTTQVKDFGSKVEVSDKFIDKIWKSSIVDDIVQLCKAKESIELSKKTDGSKKSRIVIPKLEDALWAGTAKSDLCTLILTEGDSAKTFGMWGRSIVGSDKFGIYPLKGKCLENFTKIPLFNGETKLAKDIQIGDILIGDDGNKRQVLTLYKGNGKMYEVQQDRGESYKVNDEHILTLCIPEHKIIFWVPSNYNWRAIYWDKNTKNMKAKEIATSIKVPCKECGIKISTKCLRKHYIRKHKNVQYVPYKLSDIDMNDSNVIEARKKLEELLSNIDDNNVIDICIQDYLNVTKSFQRKLKGIRGECVNWEHKDVSLDPYVLGLWLGDGMKSGYAYSCDGKNDPEIVDYLNEWGKNNDANFKQSSNKCTFTISSIENFGKMGYAPLKKQLSEYNLIKNKHIPKDYLVNSKEIRLKVLAGIVDTDGYITPDGTIEISQSVLVNDQLAQDIVYLSRSLGFYTHINKKITNYKYVKTGGKTEAYIIKISGDTDIIPTRLPRKKSTSTTQYNMRNSTGTITIKEINNENYIGIGIDGNNRFLINDFTVTHNCLNVRDATVQQLINNEEINNLKQIIGLKQGKEYQNTSELRYGKVMLLVDADVDGSHIKALLVNFFHAQWPSLLKLDFLQTLRTPIIKAIKGKKILEFFTEQDYNKWKESVNTNSYHIRYFKGLGTSQKKDAQETFKKMDTLKIDYYYKDNKCDETILLAFEKDKNISKKVKTDTKSESETVDQIETKKSCTDKRKAWLSCYDKNLYIASNEKRVSYQDLINKELIHFSIYDNTRSIPNLCDGLKPSQRKILHYMLNKNITKSIKVAQLSGYVSAETGYHHGEASLQQAIVCMAQNFIGTNNINLLYPDGNFGSRLMGSKDAASPRYIYTHLSQITQNIFNKHDAPLLDTQYDDGQVIEPEWYIPVIPMVLVNGCEGIGTGYSTYVPPHNPKDIIANILRVMNDSQPLPMKPFFKGFKGEVVSTGEGSYVTKGRWEKMSDGILRVTELPIGMWVTHYKEFLESLIEETGKKTQGKQTSHKVVLKDVKNKTSDENDGICFDIYFKDTSLLDKLIGNGTLEKELKLVKSFNTNNMYLFDDTFTPSKYKTTNDILLDFYDIRLEFYGKRKDYLIKKYEKELSVLQAKVRFINEYISSELDINRKSKDYVLALLEERGYPKHSDGQSEEVDKKSDVDKKSYDYLTRMPVIALTKEKIEELEKQTRDKQQQLEALKRKTDVQLWKDDLEQLTKFIE